MTNDLINFFTSVKGWPDAERKAKTTRPDYKMDQVDLIENTFAAEWNRDICLISGFMTLV